jgi:hypothetical protein
LPTAVVFLPVLFRAPVLKSIAIAVTHVSPLHRCLLPKGMSNRCTLSSSRRRPEYNVYSSRPAHPQVTVVLQWRPGQSGPKHH